MNERFGSRHPRVLRVVSGALVASSALASAAHAQQPQPAARPAPAAGATAAAVPGPAVGDVAPAFSLVGATRYGVLRDSVRLADFKGKTVVLAFFYKARTKG